MAAARATLVMIAAAEPLPDASADSSRRLPCEPSQRQYTRKRLRPRWHVPVERRRDQQQQRHVYPRSTTAAKI